MTIFFLSKNIRLRIFLKEVMGNGKYAILVVQQQIHMPPLITM